MLGWNRLIDSDTFLQTIDNDSSLLETVIQLFKEQSQDTLSGMKAALIEADWQAFERVAHDLKNIGRSVASDRLVEHSHQLEQLAAQQQLEAVKEKIDETTKLLGKALNELQSLQDHLRKHK